MLTRTQKIKWETRPAQKSITQMLDEQFSIQELRISKEFQKKKIKYFYASLGRGLMKNFLFKNGGFQKNFKKDQIFLCLIGIGFHPITSFDN